MRGAVNEEWRGARPPADPGPFTEHLLGSAQNLREDTALRNFCAANDLKTQ